MSRDRPAHPADRSARAAVAEPGKAVEPTITYLETTTGAIYLDKPHETAAYQRIWADLDEQALNPSRSMKLIRKIAEEYSRA